MQTVNPFLLGYARRMAKQGFVAGGDPAAGGGAPPGAPPPDAGGAPPPMDPSMGGGAPPPDAGGAPPPPDPSAGGAPPPDAGGVDPSEIDAKIQMAVQQAMQMMGSQGGPGGQGPKQPKPDINTIATDVFQLKKMILAKMRHDGQELPPDILDGPNRDPETGAPALSPTGGSDVPPGSADLTAANAIKPIKPIQPAFLNAISGGRGTPAAGMVPGGNKTAGAPQLPLTPAGLVKQAAELLRIYAFYKEARAVDAWASWTQPSEEEKMAASNKDIYGNPNGPGSEFVVPKASQSVQSHAAALVSLYNRRRG